MVSIVIMAHGQLGEALRVAAAQIVGEIQGMTYFSINSEVALEILQRDLNAQMTASSEGCIILVDLLGGTPFILAGEGLQRESVRVITGVNLPMLMALQANRHKALEDLFDVLLATGREGIRGLKRSDVEGGPLCLS
jgi:mannose/fructose-specific phosphotransferase system component IIA